ncbi:hypothetical protein BT69DRAFT_1196534, partial [Atractiella rhizophila]
RLTASHTGKYLAERIAGTLKRFGIDGKVLGMVGDSASNNDTMITELNQLLPNFKGTEYQVRCL